ncbi:hypothetical protein, partial [Collinsella sp. AM29-10AC]|uniref:hypothetical protein n=1 Tax=Collinsella sp. AM29-10AC TaxID=2292313 RepID=UPI001F2CCCA3
DQKVYAVLFSCQFVRSGGRSLSLPKHRHCLGRNLPKRDRFILVGFIWANVVIYRNVVVRVLSIRIEKKVNYFYEVTTSD